MNALVAPLIATLKESHPSSRLSDVERAFEVAKDAHQGQFRKSGEEYITHPVAVSQILAELGLLERTEGGGVSCPYTSMHIDMYMQAA